MKAIGTITFPTLLTSDPPPATFLDIFKQTLHHHIPNVNTFWSYTVIIFKSMYIIKCM